PPSNTSSAEDLTGTRGEPGVVANTPGPKTTPDLEDQMVTKVGVEPTAHAPQSQSKEQSAPALADEAKAKSLSTLKDFRLIKKLGEGGMGTVYKAQQLSLDRMVAVKVPFRHLAKDPSFVARFYREARIMAKLDHPNILRCYSVGEENGWHYLAM